MSYVYAETGVTYQSEDAAVMAMLNKHPEILDDEIANYAHDNIYQE